MLENLYYNSTLSPNIVNSENSPTKGDLDPELFVKEPPTAATLIDILAPVIIDLVSEVLIYIN